MRLYEIIWKARFVDKGQRKHKVTTDEVKQVLFSEPHIRWAEKERVQRGIMNNTKKPIEPIPEEFASYEEAAEFWDSHDKPLRRNRL